MDSYTRRIRTAAIVATIVLLAGCSSRIGPVRSSPAQLAYKTQVINDLLQLPAPAEPVPVAVYKFRDQTGQFKDDDIVTYSTAVTQGAAAMLVKSLQDAGYGRWFTILERESLADLLNERKIIRQTRAAYLSKDDQSKIDPLPPLLYAPIIFDGGVISYETNTITGGAGARYLGIGASTEYRRDTVTVYLRAVSVKNGQVLKSVSSSKTIFSVRLDASVFKFIAETDLLEAEVGFTTNEPPQMAVQEAIEKAVYAMVMEGTLSGLWNFADASAAKPLVDKYLAEKSQIYTPILDEKGEIKGFKRAAAPRPPLPSGGKAVQTAQLPQTAAARNTTNAAVEPAKAQAAATVAPTAVPPARTVTTKEPVHRAGREVVQARRATATTTYARTKAASRPAPRQPAATGTPAVVPAVTSTDSASAEAAKTNPATAATPASSDEGHVRRKKARAPAPAQPYRKPKPVQTVTAAAHPEPAQPAAPIRQTRIPLQIANAVPSDAEIVAREEARVRTERQLTQKDAADVLVSVNARAAVLEAINARRTKGASPLPLHEEDATDQRSVPKGEDEEEKKKRAKLTRQPVQVVPLVAGKADLPPPSRIAAPHKPGGI